MANRAYAETSSRESARRTRSERCAGARYTRDAKDLEQRLKSEIPYNKYLRKAGEIEARDTAARASLSDLQRASEMPYASQGIPLEEWIVDFRGGKAASAGKKGLADIELKPAKIPTRAESDALLKERGISEADIQAALDRMKKKKGKVVR